MGSRSLRESRRLGPLSGSLCSRLCRSTSVHAIAAPVLGFRRVCAFDAFCVSEGGRVSESSQHTVTSRKNAADGPRPARPPRGRPFVVRPDLAANRAEAACRFDRAPLTTTICADLVFRACAAFAVFATSATSSITAPSHSLRPAAEASRATNAITSTLSPCR